jgi:hypothetical protein
LPNETTTSTTPTIGEETTAETTGEMTAETTAEGMIAAMTEMTETTETTMILALTTAAATGEEAIPAGTIIPSTAEIRTTFATRVTLGGVIFTVGEVGKDTATIAGISFLHRRFM